MDLAAELQKIYDSEINVRIIWLGDYGIEVRLGDEGNGFLAEETFALVDGVLPWLQRPSLTFIPTLAMFATWIRSENGGPHSSSFGLRGQARRFVVRAAVHLPRGSGMEEPIVFICLHCGQTSVFEPPKIQGGPRSGEHDRLSPEQVALHKGQLARTG